MGDPESLVVDGVNIIIEIKLLKERIKKLEESYLYEKVEKLEEMLNKFLDVKAIEIFEDGTTKIYTYREIMEGKFKFVD